VKLCISKGDRGPYPKSTPRTCLATQILVCKVVMLTPIVPGIQDTPVGFGNAAPSGLEGTSGGLEKDYAGTGAMSRGTEGAYASGTQPGAQGIGSGITTHDAYDNDPNKHNKLHKVS